MPFHCRSLSRFILLSAVVELAGCRALPPSYDPITLQPDSLIGFQRRPGCFSPG